MNPTTIRIARVCHEANRAYSLAIGEDPATVFPEWDKAPVPIQESAILGVERALEGASPEQLHVSWLGSKQRDGWVYGPVKDIGKKQHPCMVAYNELPPAQRLKDALFQAIVHALKS